MPTNEPGLGKLERIDPRTFWKNEAQDFTPWLASPKNILLLGNEIHLDLEFEAREKEVGKFWADILCKDTRDGSWVVIENQLEPADHRHLGQILTYGAGLDARAVVWVATSFSGEFRAALDWLNEITAEEFGFFGVEIELWRIGDSPVAPKFNVVCRPNEWSRSVQNSARTDLTQTQRIQLSFWTQFKRFMDRESTIRCQKPAPQHWLNHPIGRSGCHLTSIASTWDAEAGQSGGELRVELALDDDNSKSFFAQLESARDFIESQIGEPLTWHNPSGKRSCRVFVRRTADITDESKWPDYHEWLRAKLEKMHVVFQPRVKALKIITAPPG